MITAQTRDFSLTSLTKENILSFVQVLGASLLIAVCAQIQIPLYFTPVPLSAQTFGVMLVGAILGSRKGAFSILLYLFEGSFLNLPFFTGGTSGLLCLLGPKGGYFMGFIVQAYLAGKCMETYGQSKSIVKIALGFFASCLIQLSMGTLWLSHFVGMGNALMMGFYPFIPGDLVKVLAVISYLKSHYANWQDKKAIVAPSSDFDSFQ